MRLLALIAIAVLGVAAGAAWVVETEPDAYVRARYPRAYAFPETRSYVAEVMRVRRMYADAYSTELRLR